jgi:uncharacterized protein YegP (UPF0339 family)
MAQRYEVRRAKDGQFYFTLQAANNEPILTSETYKRKASALHGIGSVMENADEGENYERLMDKTGKPYFVLKADNHEVIGKSESYSSNAAMENGIAAVKSNAPTAPVVDQT